MDRLVKDKEPAGTKIIPYTLVEGDARDDQLICGLRVYDGFAYSRNLVTKTDWFESEPYVIIPDTPVVGTGIDLETRQNTKIAITISWRRQGIYGSRW